MKKILYSTMYSFKEIKNSKIFYSFLIFALILISGSYFVSQTSFINQGRIMVDFSIFAITIFQYFYRYFHRFFSSLRRHRKEKRFSCADKTYKKNAIFNRAFFGACRGNNILYYYNDAYFLLCSFDYAQICHTF